MTRRTLAFFVALGCTACSGSSSSPSSTPAPSAPSPSSGPAVPTSTQANAIAAGVGSVTVSALASGAAQFGITDVTPSGHVVVQAASGSNYGGASCPNGGRIDLIYIRDYTPANGDVDVSALKEVFTACALSSDVASASGELAMSGHYFGSRQTPNISLSGSLTTSAGACSLNGSVDASGGFGGTACGTTVTPKPAPAPSPTPAPTPSINLTGTWSGTMKETTDPSGFASPVTWTATQTGTTVTGPVAVTLEKNRGILAATLSGVFSGSTLSLTMTVPGYSNAPAACSSTGVGTATPTSTSVSVTLAITYTSACAGSIDTGTGDPLHETDLLSLTKP